MATSSLSSATSYLHSFRRRNSSNISLQGVSNVECNFAQNQVARTNVSVWRSAANYVGMDCGVKKFSGKAVVMKQLPNQAGTFRCATMEEIEAEKSLIETDTVWKLIVCECFLFKKQRMEKTIDTIRSNFNSVRTNRANPSMLDRIEVEYYGTPVSLKSIAQISTPDASSLLITPYDKSSLKSIEKALVSSQLGITPSNDGEVIRLSLPPLTTDRRKELSKVVSKLAEEGKVAVRNIRRDALKAYEKLEKEKKLSEDNVKDLSADLQKLTDEYMKKVESIYKQKEQSVLECNSGDPKISSAISAQVLKPASARCHVTQRALVDGAFMEDGQVSLSALSESSNLVMLKILMFKSLR
uniref:Ribosome-recycling factor, chloroplastic n=1 Tax=Chenopodium quinoa TaxID=63459 RepID=A0A803MVU6_CHEQI